MQERRPGKKHQLGLKRDQVMKLKSLLFCSMVAATGATHAEGFYVVGAIGQSRVHDDISRSDFPGADSFSHDTQDTAYKFQVGYQLSENFALEGGYVDLGKSSVKASTYLPDPRVTNELTGNWQASGLTFAGVLTLPINEGLSIFGKLGVINAKVESKISVATYGGIFPLVMPNPPNPRVQTISESSTNIKPSFGIGARYDFGNGVGIRGEIERFNNLGDDDKTGEADVDLYSIGVTYNF